jgi:four helix bundle protein
MTDQSKKSSRSVCTNLAEACRRRKYKDHTLSKLINCKAENTETEVWLDFAKDCIYIPVEEYNNWFAGSAEVRKRIYYMINNHDKFI